MKVQIRLTQLVAKTILRIKQGRILAVKISGCQGTGKVSCFGEVILEKETTELQFPGVIKLGSGIEIASPLKIKVT